MVCEYVFVRASVSLPWPVPVRGCRRRSPGAGIWGGLAFGHCFSQEVLAPAGTRCTRAHRECFLYCVLWGPGLTPGTLPVLYQTSVRPLPPAPCITQSHGLTDGRMNGCVWGCVWWWVGDGGRGAPDLGRVGRMRVPVHVTSPRNGGTSAAHPNKLGGSLFWRAWPRGHGP